MSAAQMVCIFAVKRLSRDALSVKGTVSSSGDRSCLPSSEHIFITERFGHAIFERIGNTRTKIHLTR